MDADWSQALARARAHAPFLALALNRQPWLAGMLERGEGEAALAAAKTVGEGADDPGVALRRERLALATVLAVGDLARAFPLATVTGELSAFADRALDRAIAEAIRARVPDEAPAGMTALALGKQGAGELNYSSDIDPILLYDPRTLPRRERDDPGEAAQRYARALLAMLTTQTGEGYVFRVDLRLRPASEVSPLAISFDGALSHYESSALAWERAAFIRARAAAGDVPAGEAFLAAIRPFVWRKNLDFTAVDQIRRLTARIRETFKGPATPAPGFDVKRGRGGIREIEFFAQVHQLIYGGRNPALRLRGTRATLDALAREGLIEAGDASVLGESYDTLRRIEHRLQMVDDHQTHELPKGDALDNVARLDGFAGAEAWLAEIADATGKVAERYDRLLAKQGTTVASPAPAADSLAAERAAQWQGTIRAMRGPEARAALDAILPELLAALERAPEPIHAVAQWERLLSRLPSAVNLLRLFELRPALLELVLRVLTLARPLAEDLARQPERLDPLIDATAFDLPGPVETLAARMRLCEAGDNYEKRLDRLRQVVGEERFALGVQLIEARHDPLEIAAGLSRVAEAALETAGEAAIAEFETAHGRVPDTELAILGLGRLGGGALTHASDLDLIYLFDGEIGRESDGPRPLTSSLYFNRLAQRVTAALSVPTAEGSLYEVDTRLRPQGTQGPTAASFEGFERYQHEDAWTWEHMALTRARPVFGSPKARATLARIVDEVLHLPRDRAKLREDVLAMRGEMAQHKPPTGPLDVKLARGGLVDVEFLVHFLQLANRTAFDPSLPKAIGALVEAGLLAEELCRHQAVLGRFLVAARLLAPDAEKPHPAAREALARACRVADYRELMLALGEARQAVAQAWQQVFETELEIET